MTSTPWLFAAAAVAWVVWSSRRPAGVALPPLVPTGPVLPLPGFANPSSFRESSGGVSPLLLAAILLPLGFFAGSHLGAKPAPQPQPDPAPVSGLDLRGKFVGEHAAEDAAITAELLGQLATTIEWDGTQAEPRLRSGSQVSELRTRAREYRTSGVRLADRQPMALDAIAAFLDRTVGTEGGPLEADDRRRWVDGFRAVSRAAAAAIGR